MSRLEKLIARLRSEPPEVSFDDVKQLLEEYDFVAIRSSGSHHIFRHQDGRTITISTKSGRKVKRIYIKKVLSLLDLDNHESN